MQLLMGISMTVIYVRAGVDVGATRGFTADFFVVGLLDWGWLIRLSTTGLRAVSVHSAECFAFLLVFLYGQFLGCWRGRTKFYGPGVCGVRPLWRWVVGVANTPRGEGGVMLLTYPGSVSRIFDLLRPSNKYNVAERTPITAEARTRASRFQAVERATSLRLLIRRATGGYLRPFLSDLLVMKVEVIITSLRALRLNVSGHLLYRRMGLKQARARARRMVRRRVIRLM